MKIEIYIGTSQCDYEEELNVDYSISDIRNLTGRNIPKSLPMKLPWTDKNIEICKFINEANIFTEITETGTIIIDGGLFLSGKINLLEISHKEYIKINISHKGWIDDLAGVKLADLDWSDDDHTLNKTTINASEDPDTTNKNYLYPVINYGEFEEVDGTLVENIGAIWSCANYAAFVAGKVQITSFEHGLMTGDVIRISGTTDMTGYFQ